MSTSNAQLINGDALQFAKTLPDNCVDLILTDPPYFKVKPNGWDNQWRGDADYLNWLDTCLAEFWRVLKPNGSIYLFSGHRLAADIELLMRQRFNLLNHIIWAKPSGRWNGCSKTSLRAFFPATERIFFAECQPGPYASDNSTLTTDGLKRHIMTPLIDYFRNAKEALGVTSKEIAEATGKRSMVSHWFGASQWQLPSESDYLKLQALFSRVALEKRQRNGLEMSCSQLMSEYSELSRQYIELVSEYQFLRRPFTVSAAVPFTDVWTYKPVRFYPGKHPCEKPADMIRDMISASSRPGQLVVDFFMGSGSTIKEAIKLGRRAIGVELEAERFEQTRREIEEIQCQKG